MNRRSFLRTAGTLSAASVIAPTMLLKRLSQPALPPVLGCPGYAAILADLKQKWLNLYGGQIAEDGSANKMLQLMAWQQCDTLCLIHRMYDHLSPSIATGVELDRLLMTMDRRHDEFRARWRQS